jgi:hypothetical protein
MTWTQITSEQALSMYGIPAEVANVADNSFYGVSIDLPYGYDNLRPFLAFLRSKERPDVVTLYIKTIHPESWEGDDGILTNSLSLTIGGHLTLDKDDLTGLIAILSSYQKQLPQKSNEHEVVFQKMENLHLKDYHLHPEWFPNTKQEYYLQIHDPVTKADTNHIVTILNFSKTEGFPKIHLSIRQFPEQELRNPNFNPLDSGQSRVNLDRTGMEELVTLLQKQQSDFK